MGRMRPDEKTRKVLAIVRECLGETTFLKVARQTGLNPSHLYRAFGADGNPCVSTFFNVCDALNMDVRLVPREPAAPDEDQDFDDDLEPVKTNSAPAGLDEQSQRPPQGEDVNDKAGETSNAQ